MRVLFLEGTEPFVFSGKHPFRSHTSPRWALPFRHPPRTEHSARLPLQATISLPGTKKQAPLTCTGEGPHGRERLEVRTRKKCEPGHSCYAANTTEQMLSRIAPNTRVNTIMGHTNLNQWDIFMSNICKVAITKPVGAM